jgi:hypothetical protein
MKYGEVKMTEEQEKKFQETVKEFGMSEAQVSKMREFVEDSVDWFYLVEDSVDDWFYRGQESMSEF